MKFIFNVMVLGDGAVGKTSLVRHFCEGTFQESYKMTIGVEFLKKTVRFEGTGDDAIDLLLWDVAGQQRFDTMRKNYYGRAQGILFLHDVTNPVTLSHVVDWKKDIDAVKPGLPAVLVGNKVDLDYDKALVEKSAGNLAAKLGMDNGFTSAKLGTGMDEVFEAITRKVYEAETN
ncbi:MAG: Rab family GTPase [Promethearchaeota archaeon]